MLPDDIDEIDDDDLYELTIWLSGAKIRWEDESELVELGTGIERPPRSRRFYPQEKNWQVHQLSKDHSVYRIRPTFEGVIRLTEELDLPRGPQEQYYSKFYSGGEYVNPIGTPIERYERYTVETFGLKIKPTSPISHPVKYEYPDPSEYISLPRYWQFSRQIIQIWRLRILDCPVEALQPSASNPLSPYHPNILYFEERWHPKQGKLAYIGGLSNVQISFAPELERFFIDTYRILEKLHPRGRPPGTSTYPDSEDFRRRLLKELRGFRRRKKYKPTEEEMALEMKISVSTLKRYLRIAGLSWREL